MLKTNGPGLWECIKESWSNGGRKYFFHNLSCQLRRGRYEDCIGYKNTLWDRILFSLGVFVTSPFGGFLRRKYEWSKLFAVGTDIRMSDTQWLRHPLPWVRSTARKIIELKEKKT